MVEESAADPFSKPKDEIKAEASSEPPPPPVIAAPVPTRVPQTESLKSRLAPSPSPAPPEQESESDDTDAPIPDGQACKRRGCEATYKAGASRDGEECVHHRGVPIFHEGSKSWSCCSKRKVLEFDQFLKIEGCSTKNRHLFVGNAKRTDEEENLKNVRSDFYQTPAAVIASFFLKKIDKENSTIRITTSTVELDLRTSDKKRYKAEVALYGTVEPEKSTYKIMGTKVEFNFVKTDGSGWPVLRADDPLTGEIIQTGKAGRA